MKLPHDKAFEALRSEAIANAIDITHDALMEPDIDKEAAKHFFPEPEATPIDVYRQVLAKLVPHLGSCYKPGDRAYHGNSCIFCNSSLDFDANECSNPTCPAVQARALLDADATPIDAETYEEYDYTDTEMLEFVFSQEATAPKRYLVKHAKTGKWAYTDKGPNLSDDQWNALDWYDTFRGAIQAEMQKDAEERNDL